MISANLTSMLSNLGWGSGFRLPVANEENRALEELLEQKQRHLFEISGTLETDTQHCEILKSHSERISSAVNQSQKMVSAKRSGIETEQNLYSLGERIYSRVKDDFAKSLNNIKEYQERNRRMTEEVEARKKVVEDLINTVKFDQVALEKYKQVTDDKEHHIKFMKTLTHLDERVSQDFQLKFGQIGEDLSNSRRALSATSMYTQTLQQQFGRLCSQFRRVHLERSQAITFWESTLKSMKQRDEDIKDVAEEYAEVRARSHIVDEQCCRKEKMLGSEQQNAMHLDYQIKKCDKNCRDFRLRLSESKEQTFAIKDELLNFKTVINQTTRMVKETRTKIQNHDNELSMMQQKLEKAQQELAESKSRYDNALLETLSEESRTKEIERMIDLEEQKTDSLLQEIEKQRRHMWQRSNDCNQLTQKLKFIVARIKGTKTMITSLKDRARNEDIKVQKKRQTAYHLELECLSLESRIHHMSQQHLQDLSGPTRENVIELREKLQEIVKTRAFLTSQESHMKNVNTRIQRDIAHVIQEHTCLKLMIENEKTEAKRCVLENKKGATDLQNLQVENRILQMTMGRLSMMKQQERDKMFTLEQQRIMMEAAAKERRSEIDLHLGILKTQQRCLKDEKNKLQMHILEMMTEIGRHKTRYEFIINALNTPGDDQDPDQSESYHILKHAQERETLKREGDLWDQKVKEAEKEIAALQNTLSVLVSSNMAFKDSLSPAADETPEAKMLSALEENQKVIMVRKRKADKIMSELNTKCLSRQTETSGISHQKMFLEGLLGEKKYELNNAHFELLNQKSKIDRASRMSSRLIKELRLHLHDDRIAIELDLKLRCAREKFEFGLKTLEKTLFMHQELRPTTLNFLSKTELEPVINRLQKRSKSSVSVSITDLGSSFLTMSGIATPTRYLTPISSAHPSEAQSDHRSRSREGFEEEKMEGQEADLNYLSEISVSMDPDPSPDLKKRSQNKQQDGGSNSISRRSSFESQHTAESETTTIYKMMPGKKMDEQFSDINMPSDTKLDEAMDAKAKKDIASLGGSEAKDVVESKDGHGTGESPEEISVSKTEGDEDEDEETEEDGNTLAQITEEEEGIEHDK